MFFHVVLTDECNMKCRYCYWKCLEDAEIAANTLETVSVPSEVSYTVSDLKKFLSKDPDCTVTFYGGEPTLRVPLMRRMMDELPVKRFMMQTNGLLLHIVGKEYINKMHTILVSVDGDEKLTDFYRGKNTFKAVTKNIEFIRKQGFKGEIIARMTVMEQTDIYEQVKYLLNHGLFDSVHWQLDANFWFSDYKKRNFLEWAKKNYNPGIRKLAEWWLEKMKEGKVPRIYPFMGIMESLLKNEKTMLRCGAGHSNFAILTDGNIVPCPVMAGLKEFYLGDIWNSHPLELRSNYVFKICPQCNIYRLCGGRCMYGNAVMPWGEKGHNEVCLTIRNLIEAMKNILPDVKRLIENETIGMKDFEYLKYNGCEIIP